MKRTIRILAGIFIVGLAIAGGLVYVIAFAPATLDYEGSRSVWITPGSDLAETADSLVVRDVLSRRKGFEFLGKITGWGDQIKAGHYVIESGVSNRDILDKLRRGLQEPVHVNIPAGTRRERVARAIAANMFFSESDARRAMADESLAMSLGTDTTQLLGYMLPDTYFFYWLTEPEDVIRKVKQSADEKLAEFRQQGTLTELDDVDVLKLASIVEWETSHVAEKSRIAGVYMNRLRNRWPLQADPTVQYAVMMHEGNKRRLLFADYRRDHPFNTYKFRGLPPGPVTNPSATSIEAAMNPEDNDFYFFVSNGDGTHEFSKTLAEHNRRANEYRALMRTRRQEQAAEPSK